MTGLCGLHLLPQRHDGGMMAQLQDIPEPFAGFTFDQRQIVQ